MAQRKFRYEFISDVLEYDEVVARLPLGYNHEEAHEDFHVVFRSKDDGKHYAFFYYYNGDVGVDNFDGCKNDDLVDCWEVQEKKVTTTTWVKV